MHLCRFIVQQIPKSNEAENASRIASLDMKYMGFKKKSALFYLQYTIQIAASHCAKLSFNAKSESRKKVERRRFL